MEVVWINFLYNPLLPIGILLSVLAVFAFLLFLRGFLSGALYLFTLNGNDDFLKPARIRVLWAFFLIVFFWCVWQLLVWVGTILTGKEAPQGLGLAITLLILLFIARTGANYLKKNT